MDLKELESGVDQRTHWYYQSKKIPLFDFVRKLLKTVPRLTLVDVGSGSGFFAYILEETFRDQIEKVYLVDIGYSEEEMAQTRGQKIEKVHFIPERMENCLVTLMDVLEHLEDDLQMLTNIRKACAGPSNHFFITVPAFKQLWSGHDDYLGHYRRYTIPMLRDVLQKAGYTPSRLFYLYGAIFPLVWIARRIGSLRRKESTSDMKPASPLVNRLLLSACSAEMKLARGNQVAGVTCAAEGRI